MFKGEVQYEVRVRIIIIKNPLDIYLLVMFVEKTSHKDESCYAS